MLTSADEWGEGVSQKLTIVQQCWRGGKGISQMLCIGTNWREFNLSYWQGGGRGGRPNADNCWRGGRGGNPNADHCPLLMAIQQQFTAQCTCSKNVSNLSLINLRWRCLVAPNNAQATILGMCPIQQNEPVTRWDFFQVTQQDVQENSVVKPWNCAPLLRGQAFNGTERRNTEKEWLID